MRNRPKNSVETRIKPPYFLSHQIFQIFTFFLINKSLMLQKVSISVKKKESKQNLHNFLYVIWCILIVIAVTYSVLNIVIGIYFFPTVLNVLSLTEAS